MNKAAKFSTIRKTSQKIDFPENRIRTMVKQGVCPGIYSGNRFLVNVDALVEQLDEQSREGVKKNA